MPQMCALPNPKVLEGQTRDEKGCFLKPCFVVGSAERQMQSADSAWKCNAWHCVGAISFTSHGRKILLNYGMYLWMLGLVFLVGIVCWTTGLKQHSGRNEKLRMLDARFPPTLQITKHPPVNLARNLNWGKAICQESIDANLAEILHNLEPSLSSGT